MRIIRVRPDRTVEIVGECFDHEPPKQPGDVIAVEAWSHTRPPILLLPYSIRQAAAPTMVFRVRRMERDGPSESVVELEAGGPHPRFLPGWRRALA